MPAIVAPLELLVGEFPFTPVGNLGVLCLALLAASQAIQRTQEVASDALANALETLLDIVEKG